MNTDQFDKIHENLTSTYGEAITTGTYDRWKVGSRSSIYMEIQGDSIYKFLTTGDKSIDIMRAFLGAPDGTDFKGRPYWKVKIDGAPIAATQPNSQPSRAVECAHCGLRYATDQPFDNGYCGTCSATPKHESVLEPSTAMAIQVGGNHYKNMKIQPAEFAQVNGLSFLQGCVIKRICRYKFKNGLEDLMKAKHEIDMIIELEYTNHD